MDRKKKLDWITWIVNMLAAPLFLGLTSCSIVWLLEVFLDICCFYINLPHKIWIVVVLWIVLTVLWGRYQYRLLILKNPRHPRVTWKSLLFLGGFVLVVTLLPFCFKLIKMKMISEEARQHRESMDKQAELTESPDRPQEEKRTEE